MLLHVGEGIPRWGKGRLRFLKQIPVLANSGYPVGERSGPNTGLCNFGRFRRNLCKSNFLAPHLHPTLTFTSSSDHRPHLHGVPHRPQAKRSALLHPGRWHPRRGRWQKVCEQLQAWAEMLKMNDSVLGHTAFCQKTPKKHFTAKLQAALLRVIHNSISSCNLGNKMNTPSLYYE